MKSMTTERLQTLQSEKADILLVNTLDAGFNVAAYEGGAKAWEDAGQRLEV